MSTQTVEFPGAPSLPNAVRWSSDNQILVVLPDIIHVVKPKWNLAGQSLSRMEFVETAVSLSPSVPISRTPSRGEDIRSSSMLVEAFRSADWSPSGLSSSAGCVMLTLTSTGAVTVLEPMPKHTSAVWEKTIDVTEAMLKHGSLDEDHLNSHDLDGLEIMSIAWSPAAPQPFDARWTRPTSLFALGSKAGKVTLWSYVSRSLCHEATIQVSKSWIVSLGWSKPMQLDDSVAWFLATGSSDGSVRLWKVTKSSRDTHTAVELVQELCGSDSRAATVIKFYSFGADVCDQTTKVAISKGTRIIVAVLEDGASKAVVGQIRLPISMAAGGITWSSCGTQLDIYHLDGQHRSIRLKDCGAAEKPERVTLLLLDENLHPEIDQVLRVSMQAPSSADADDEPGNSNSTGDQEPRYYGADSSAYGFSDAVLLWAHKPFDMGYITPRTIKCTLAIAPCADPEQAIQSKIISRLEEALCQRHIFRYRSPAHVLWDLVTDMYRDVKGWINPEGVYALVVQSLKENADRLQSQENPSTTRLVAATQSGSFDRAFEELEDWLCGSNYLNSLRIFTHLYETTKHTVNTSDLKDDMVDLNRENASEILSCYLAFLAPVVQMYIQEYGRLTALDRRVIALIVHSAHQQRESLEARGVWSTYEAMLAVLHKTSGSHAIGKEVCPACEASIEFNNSTTATCAHGHEWERCSATFLVLSNPLTRLCQGCGRSWFDLSGLAQLTACGLSSANPQTLVSDMDVDHDTVDSLCERLLQASHICLYCGDRGSVPIDDYRA
ncbi:putative zinc-finger of transcription factor IIIC complex-domain-containing protein [Polychytrium aggregatum]|uniref:putative zinc-finger of transcription factor IIIC complex-domain-containing protein n=1 Tax=Polychytrium aggregatum TaxID=110093 RepID=UPI0022FDE6CD|nr:putative zinc-finger of transcription factor IIIC complex-domain-containing protein [Polychytrium aggregatum]KAI9201792.1 putative zinc-finger of transcription factor IIIC complex-domain-containing protein [Polychytrium aggregatum]